MCTLNIQTLERKRQIIGICLSGNQITHYMCCFSKFSCYLTMISYFSILKLSITLFTLLPSIVSSILGEMWWFSVINVYSHIQHKSAFLKLVSSCSFLFIFSFLLKLFSFFLLKFLDFLQILSLKVVQKNIDN